MLGNSGAWKSSRCFGDPGGKTHQRQLQKPMYSDPEPGGSIPEKGQDLREYQQNRMTAWRLGQSSSLLLCNLKCPLSQNVIWEEEDGGGHIP